MLICARSAARRVLLPRSRGLLSCDACRLGWVLHAAGKIGDVGARALATSLEKNTTLKKLNLESARLCARWRGVEQRSRFIVLGRAPQGVGSPCRARGSSSCRRDACRVGCVLCTPQAMASATTARELWRRRSRRTRRSRSSASTVRGSVLAVAVGKGDVWRGPTAGGCARARTMQSELARAAGRRACGVGSPCRARGSSFLSG